ncbi:MAG: hypothetical protein KDA80_17195, partial [Planctomycetaceae bacterium]|nr:hypothetical protein [Planctomycetaceae bacterium]
DLTPATQPSFPGAILMSNHIERDDVTLDSGRTVAMSEIKSDVAYILEHMYSEPSVAVRRWAPDGQGDPLQILQTSLSLLGPHSPPVRIEKPEGLYVAAAKIVNKSHFSELLDVPDDYSSISLRSDVPREILKDVFEFILKTMPGGVS